MGNERDRVDRVFQARQTLAEKYCLDNPGNRFNFDILCARLAAGFHTLPLDPVQARILDLGAGELFWGDRFAAMAVPPQHYFGVDLLLWRLQQGRKSGRGYQAVAASAADLPFPDASFDLVSQFTMMTSVLDDAVKSRIAAETIRVLKPNGYILWYDFRYSNPGNRNARGIDRKEMARLFPGLPIRFETVTLVPPLARKLPLPLLKFFYRFPILRTHYLAWIGPKG
ncbi:MAG: class I SAM-dependent methyltransferase [candidate division Zixibacteria bacterium]|nr:class I SAM-dependent methyltransferase [candidate division Zixibacteria bacterium]